MKTIAQNTIVSVRLYKIEVSEDEIDVYESCARYIYENFSEEDIEKICGAEKEELFGMCEQLSFLLKTREQT